MGIVEVWLSRSNSTVVKRGTAGAPTDSEFCRFTCKTTFFLSGRCWDRTSDLCRVKAALSKVYVWPLDRRPKDRAGRYGSLHAKFAVADEAALLVSSANLTEYAFNFNMELGLLVRGGDQPADVMTHLRRLVEERVLLPI